MSALWFSIICFAVACICNSICLVLLFKKRY